MSFEELGMAGEPVVGSERQVGSHNVLMGTTALVMGFVFFQSPELYSEWKGLQNDWARTRASAPIGFLNIAPRLSYAQPPEPWKIVEGDTVRLWAGWKQGEGHQWFRIGKDDLELDRMAQPMGRDVIRAIERPMRDTLGGTLYERMQPESAVIGYCPAPESASAYPMMLLQKVEAVNDVVQGRPIVVVHSPFTQADDAVDLFDATLEGRKLTMGSSGLFLMPGPRPLFFDHQTESLWMVRDHQLRCVAGSLKGKSLLHISRGQPVEWSDWQGAHPRTQLVVGAYREGEKPFSLNW